MSASSWIIWAFHRKNLRLSSMRIIELAWHGLSDQLVVVIGPNILTYVSTLYMMLSVVELFNSSQLPVQRMLQMFSPSL